MNLADLVEPWAGDVDLGEGVVLLQGKMESRLSGLPSSFTHGTITDAPYHLKKIVARFGKANSAPVKSSTGPFARQSRGFLGKTWDGGDVAFQAATWAHCLRLQLPGSWLLNFTHPRKYHRITSAIEDAGFEIRDSIQWVYGTGFPSGSVNLEGGRVTLLKPAHEPITLARRPIEEASVRAQVEATGTGCLNARHEAPGGRWVPNLLLDEWGAGELGEQATPFPVFRYCPKPSVREKEAGLDELEARMFNRVNPGGLEHDPRWAPKKRKNTHATPKPLALMRWLVRLVTPPGGIVLDPFMGSGTTGMAAVLEGRRFIGVEMEDESFQIAVARIRWAQMERMFE